MGTIEVLLRHGWPCQIEEEAVSLQGEDTARVACRDNIQLL